MGWIFPHPKIAPRAWGRREDHLVGLLGRATVELSDDDLEALAGHDPRPLPSALAVMASVAAVDWAAVDRGDFGLVVHGASGPFRCPASRSFLPRRPGVGRLAAAPPSAEEALYPDAVFAEVVHLPRGRTGNILHRPVLRAYEIPLLGRSGAPLDRQLPPADLLVSIRGGEVVLHSRRLGRRVIPRLTSAHNPNWRSIGLYRFLCALQDQGSAAVLGWSWKPLEAARFLPRVSRGRLILCPATWRVDQRELSAITTLSSLDRWRHSRGLPRFARLTQGDNALPVDFENPASTEVFLHAARQLEHATITEMVPGPDQLCAVGPEGRYVHELVVPFVATWSALHGARPRADGRDRSPVLPAGIGVGLRANSTPDPRWSTSCCARLPSRSRPRASSGSSCATTIRTIISGYVSAAMHPPCWPILHDATAPALADGRIWRLVLDTYEREVHRYGGPEAMALCEEIFHADSDACLGIILRLSPGDRGADQRWRLALRGIDVLLADLGLPVAARLAVVRRGRRGLAQEHRVDGRLERQLAARFRAERASLEALLDPAPRRRLSPRSRLRVAGPTFDPHRSRGRRAAAAAKHRACGTQPGTYARQPIAASGPTGAGARVVRLPDPSLHLGRGSHGRTGLKPVFHGLSPSIGIDAMLNAPAFTLGEHCYTWGEVFAVARRQGEWAAFEREVRQGAALQVAGLALPAPVRRQEEDSFRRPRRLLAAEDLEQWLAARQISVLQWRRHITRTGLLRRYPPRGEVDPEPEDLRVSGWCAGAFESFARTLACDLVGTEGIDESPAELDRIVQQRYLDWVRVDMAVATFGSEDAAREAILQVRLDGREHRRGGAASFGQR